MYVQKSLHKRKCICILGGVKANLELNLDVRSAPVSFGVRPLDPVNH